MKKNVYDGTLVVFEGADGAGTTTQSKKFEDTTGGFWTREHTRNKIGRKVDEMIEKGGYSPEAVAMGFSADRIVHLEEEVIPRLKKGQLVIMDRYYHSSLVYQPVLGAEYEWVKEINKHVVKPDLTIILDAELETAISRLREREKGLGENIFENMEFQDRVIVGYRKLAEKLDENIVFVKGEGGKDEVFQEVMEKVRNELPDLVT